MVHIVSFSNEVSRFVLAVALPALLTANLVVDNIVTLTASYKQ